MDSVKNDSSCNQIGSPQESQQQFHEEPEKNKAIHILIDTLAMSCLIFVLIGSTAHARQREQVQNAQNKAHGCQTVTRTYSDYRVSASNSILNNFISSLL